MLIAVFLVASTALVKPFVLPSAPRSSARLAASPRLSAAASEAVVVGGGPAGLATALVLSKRGFDVTVLEKRAEPNPYEPQRAYLYLVDGRGQRFTDAAGITEELASPEASVSSLNYTVTRCLPDGEREEVVPPILEASDRASYWIPRARFLALLNGALPPTVKTLFGSELHEVQKTADGGIEVVATCADGSELRLTPSLLIGADGLQSLVRQKCAEWSGAPEDFTPVVLPSPSSGLSYQMIKMPPDLRLDKTDASITAEPRKAYSIRPATDAPLGPTRLGMLPVADPLFPRTANVILPPEHPVWSLGSGDAVLGWLRATFPHLPIDEVISADEAAAFAEGAPGAFPAPCYSPRQQLLLPKAGVVLVGDAIHAFPPDIGQGVNSALSDVMMLSEALDGAAGSGDDPMAKLREALPAYEAAAAPEAEAVARIAQIGFPYQYPITREKSPLQKVGWFANFFLRTFVLSKLLPSLFSPAAIVLVQRPQLSYAQVWRMAKQTTRRLQGLALVAVLGAAWPWLRRLAVVL